MYIMIILGGMSTDRRPMLRARLRAGNTATVIDPGYMKVMSCLAVARRSAHDPSPMGDYPGRKQVRTRARRAVKNDRIIEQRAAEKKAAKPAAAAKK